MFYISAADIKYMLISISGRKLTGKTTLANELVKKGFRKIAFADTLKDLLCEIYNWKQEHLIEPRYKEEILNPCVMWNEKTAKKLEKLIKATKPVINDSTVLKTRRDAMQFIGTEVLRKYDTDFHTKEFEKGLNPKEDLVCDDVRMKNENDVIKNNGGISVGIIRPYLNTFSNHFSETDLNRSMFEYLIINDTTKSKFMNKFYKFFNNINSHYFSRSDVVTILEAANYDIITAAKIMKLSKNKTRNIVNSYLIHKPDLEYNGLFLNKNKESEYWYNEIIKKGSLSDIFTIDITPKVKEFMKVINFYGETNGKLTISSQYMIDDLKLFRA